MNNVSYIIIPQTQVLILQIPSTLTVEHDENSVPVLDSDVSPNSYFQPSTINDCPKTTDISLPIIEDYGSTSIASSVSIPGSTISSTTTTTKPSSSISMTTMSTKKIFPMSKAMSASSLPCVTPHMKPAVSALTAYSSLPRKSASSHIHNRTLEPSSVSCASPSSSTSRPAHRGVPFQAKFTTPPSVLHGNYSSHNILLGTSSPDSDIIGIVT